MEILDNTLIRKKDLTFGQKQLINELYVWCSFSDRNMSSWDQGRFNLFAISHLDRFRLVKKCSVFPRLICLIP